MEQRKKPTWHVVFNDNTVYTKRERLILHLLIMDKLRLQRYKKLKSMYDNEHIIYVTVTAWDLPFLLQKL